VVVALFFVWASMIGGAAPHIVSATRIAILIFRENIIPFSIAIVGYANEAASDGEKSATTEYETFRGGPAVRLEYTPLEGIFPE
jgi:hypothetical protein